jgi:hypothetical protein
VGVRVTTFCSVEEGFPRGGNQCGTIRLLAFPFHDHNPVRWPLTLGETKLAGVLSVARPWAFAAAT